MYRCDNNVGCLSVSAHRVGEELKVSAHRVGEGIKVSAGIICTVNKDKFLRVQPAYIMLTNENPSATIKVTSNVIWEVTYE